MNKLGRSSMLNGDIAKQLQDKMKELENKARAQESKTRKKSQNKAPDKNA